MLSGPPLIGHGLWWEGLKGGLVDARLGPTMQV